MLIGVTGYSGFIGEKFVQNTLNETDYNLLLIGRNFPKKYFDNSRITFVPFNLQDSHKLENIEVDVLTHLAWEGLPNYNANIHEQQVSRHVDFLTKKVSRNTSKILIAGTCFEYGHKQGAVYENQQVCPNNSYARAKVALFNELISDQFELKNRIMWMRLFYIYGEGQQEKSLWGSMIEASMRGDLEFEINNSQRLLDFLSVENLADYLVQLISPDVAYAGIVNIGTGTPRSVGEVAEEIKSLNNLKLNLKMKKTPLSDIPKATSFWANTEKLHELLQK